MSKKTRVVVLGAGFGGLELTSLLSEAMGDAIDVVLIDKNDSFTFGFSKIEVMFGRAKPEAVRIPFARIAKPGVRVRQEAVTAIDPHARRVTTDKASYDADNLVIALGADCDPAATPGLLVGGHEFYSLDGAARLRDALPAFTKGRVIVGVASAPFKCPPAPSEAVLLMHDYLTTRGIRGGCEISLVMPLPVPVPPSPDTSKALLAAFAERGIRFVPGRAVRALDPHRHVVVLDDGSEMPYELFIGIPKHHVPKVVAKSGLAENGWIPVDSKTLATKFPGVYAFGDVANVGVPKAGVFAEGAARTVAQAIVASARGGEQPGPYPGAGSCYVEFGEHKVARVDVNFFGGAAPTGTFNEPSTAMVAEKKQFAASRQRRWFGA